MNKMESKKKTARSKPIEKCHAQKLSIAAGGVPPLIALVGAEELGWHFPYDAVHDAEYAAADLPLGALIGWSVNTLISAVVGFFWGLIVVGAVASLPKGSHPAEPDDAPAGHH